jgi:Ca2+/Na+ antiporter
VTRAPVRREGIGLLGVATTACIACCAGPILAFLGGLGVAGLANSLAIGTTGLVIAAAAASAWLLVRRRHRVVAVAASSELVPVEAPTRKP